MSKMNPDVNKSWVAALRSGDYKQGTRALNKDGKMCCLGVLCDLYIKAHPEEKWEEITDPETGTVTMGLQGSKALLPQVVKRWAEMPTGVGHTGNGHVEYDGVTRALVNLNDTGESFSKIADLIEEQL